MKKFIRILALSLVAVMLCASLASCGAPAKDAAKAEKALEDEGYTVVKDDKLTPVAFKALGYDLDCVVSGTKIVEDKDGNKSVEHVSIYYVADKENAEKALEKVKEYASDDKEDDDSDWVDATRSGSMVYYGTKAGVKAAR